MSKRIYLHIGTHKTGSTSIQQCCYENRPTLEAHGITFPPGERLPSNHTDLYVAAMRSERDSFAKLKWNLTVGPEYIAEVQKRWDGILDAAETPGVLITNEGLALLRYRDEIEQLKRLIQADANDVQVIVYLREKSAFLASYTRQVFNRPGREPSDDPTSVLYVKPDTWLIDYDQLLAVYREGFGADRVIVQDYDAVVARDGSVVPSFLEQIGVPVSAVDNAGGYRLNVSSSR